MPELLLALAVVLVVLTVIVCRQAPPVIEYDDEVPLETFVDAVCVSVRCDRARTRHDVLASGRLMCRNCDRVVVAVVTDP